MHFLNKKWLINRRTVLRGMGTAISLPLLDAMIPTALAQSASPKRAIWIYQPNGIFPGTYKVSGSGTLNALPPTLAPLDNLKEHLLIVNGLHNSTYGFNGGGHAASCSGWLTNVNVPRKPAFRAGISADQRVAEFYRGQTKIDALVLGTEGTGSGTTWHDDSHVVTVSQVISWTNADSVADKDYEPQKIFDRLFGSANIALNLTQQQTRKTYQKSILDFALADAKRLERNLGEGDRQKLDEYLTHIRDLERAMGDTDQLDGTPGPQCSEATLPGSNGAYKQTNPEVYDRTLDHMYELMAMAIQCDVTRAISFMMLNEANKLRFTNLGLNGDFHSSYSHRTAPEWKSALQKIDKYHVEKYAAFLSRLAAMREGEGSVLDNVAAVYGTANNWDDTGSTADPNRNAHSRNNVQIVVAGGLGGEIRTGRSIQASGTRISNLWAAILKGIGVADQHGDSNGLINLT